MEATTADTAPTNPANGDFTAAYTSFKTLLSAADRMKEQGGAPSRVDRSYLSNLPGGAQTIFQSSLKSLGLIDDSLRPTPVLEAFVDAPESERKLIVAELLREHYPGPLGLGERATQSELEDEFRKLGVSGSTMRKAVGFYLNAARFAGIPVSPNFKLPKLSPSPPRKRIPKQDPPTGGGGESETRRDTPPDPTDAKARYIDLLLKKAEAADGADTDLLDRIERVIGVEIKASNPGRAEGGDPA